jgi:nicotinate phosphoribosyltransferase
VLAGEPLLEVTAPIAEAQLVETALLNEITFQTAVASKAARCRLAAGGADLVDFAFRRTQGTDAAMAGFIATSNVEAARRFGLAARHVPIDAYGVGTKVGVSADAPYLDTAYKLVAYGRRPVMKLSPGKRTAPGPPKQVFRGPLSEGDIVGMRDEPVPAGHEPLLVPVMVGGRPTGANADLAAAQARFDDDLGRLPATARALQDARPPPVRLSEQLEGLRERVRAQLPQRDRPARP